MVSIVYRAKKFFSERVSVNEVCLPSAQVLREDEDGPGNAIVAAAAAAAAVADTFVRIDVEKLGEVVVPIADVLRVVDADGIGGAGGKKKDKNADITTFSYQPGRVHFRGVQKGLPLAFLKDEAAGWIKHSEEPFSQCTQPRHLDRVPADATHVLVGALKDKAKSMALAAIGERRVVLPPHPHAHLLVDEAADGGDQKDGDGEGQDPQAAAASSPHDGDGDDDDDDSEYPFADVGTTNKAKAHNGAFWYCVANRAFGFAPSPAVSLGSADTVDPQGRKDGDRRMSWHLNGSGGYRAGRETGLNSSREWLKVVYYRRNGYLRPIAAFDARALARIGVPRDAGGRAGLAPKGGGDDDDDDDDDDEGEPTALAMSACLNVFLRHLLASAETCVRDGDDGRPPAAAIAAAAPAAAATADDKKKKKKKKKRGDDDSDGDDEDNAPRPQPLRAAHVLKVR